jgi:hypothetical protein
VIYCGTAIVAVIIQLLKSDLSNLKLLFLSLCPSVSVGVCPCPYCPSCSLFTPSHFSHFSHSFPHALKSRSCRVVQLCCPRGFYFVHPVRILPVTNKKARFQRLLETGLTAIKNKIIFGGGANRSRRCRAWRVSPARGQLSWLVTKCNHQFRH